MNKRIALATSIVALGALALTGCAAESTPAANPATGEPINIASIASLAYFPEAAEAAQAYFDKYNANGGFNGRPVELKTYDDKGDPATSVTVASDVVASDAIALVSSASLLDCAVNAKTYQDNGIVSLTAVGTDPFCFDVPAIAPANSGPFLGTVSSLYYGSEVLGYQNVCAVIVKDDALSEAIFTQLFANWEKSTGKKMAYVDNTLTRGQASYAANIAQLKQQKCDALFVNEVGPAVLSLLGEATNQGVSLPVLGLTSMYSDQFAAAAASYGGDIYLPAEFVPYSSDDPANADWAALMDKDGIAKTSFAQGGYAMAKAFIAVLETIDGDLTRDSFTTAAKAMTETIESPMLGGTWIFGDAEAHQPNTNTWPVVLRAGSGRYESLGVKLTGEEVGWTPLTLK